MTTPQRHPFQILLVEDNPADAELTRYGLESARAPHELAVVENGDDALDYVGQKGRYAEARRPDLILLDLNLPGTDGRAVLKALKSSEDTAQIPIIIFTTSSAPGDIEAAYRNHANAYMTKPQKFSQMTTLIRALDDYWFDNVLFPRDLTLP